MTPLPETREPLPELRPAVLASRDEYDAFVRSMPDHGTEVDWNWLAATGWETGRWQGWAVAGGPDRGQRAGQVDWRPDRDGDLARLPAGLVDGKRRWLYVEFYVTQGPACRLSYGWGDRPNALPILDNPTRGQVRALMDVLGA